MSLWVETASGNLLRASEVNGIAAASADTSEGGKWDLCVGVGGPLSTVARNLSREQATALRTRLAVLIDHPTQPGEPMAIRYEEGQLAVAAL